MLVQHFALVAGERPVPAPCLDVLTRALVELAPEVPYYAATVARARIARMADQLTAALAGLGGVTARVAADAAGTLSAAVSGAKVTTSGSAAAAAERDKGKTKGKGKGKGKEEQKQKQQQQPLVAVAPGASPWPGARAVLQLKLFSLLFPTSDRRHPVLTPAALLVGEWLGWV